MSFVVQPIDISKKSIPENWKTVCKVSVTLSVTTDVVRVLGTKQELGKH